MPIFSQTAMRYFRLIGVWGVAQGARNIWYKSRQQEHMEVRIYTKVFSTITWHQNPYNFPISLNVNKFLPSSPPLTHPLLPTCSFTPLESCLKAFSSPSFAINRWPFFFIRPTICPRKGLPSRLNSTVYVCKVSLALKSDAETHLDGCFPFRMLINNRNRLIFQQIWEWISIRIWRISRPIWKTDDILIRHHPTVRKNQPIVTFPFPQLSHHFRQGLHWGQSTLQDMWDTYVHRIVISGSSKRCQPSQKCDGLWLFRRGKTKMLTCEFWYNGETSGDVRNAPKIDSERHTSRNQKNRSAQSPIQMPSILRPVISISRD